MSCVNIKSKEFKELVNKTGISSSNLELIIYSYQNNEGHEGEFPSIEYIMSKLTGTNNVVSDAQVELWETKYSTPLKFKDSNSLNEAVTEASRYYRSEAITTWEDNEGNYVMKVAEPQLSGEAVEREYERILANAHRDKEGRLLAPNGRPSNLNERQYAQVRSKAFKRWFGDWESDPENASKVVDENGEPLVMYHGTTTPNIHIFSLDKTKSGPAFWFANKEGQKAVYYGNNSDQNLILMPLFINMRKPLLNDPDSMEAYATDESHDGGLVIGYLKDFKGIFEDEEYTEILEKGLSENSYLATGNVTNSNQIKSAENIGTFETREDNIYHDNLPTSYKDSRDITLWNLFESNKDKESITIEAEASIIDIIDRIKDSEYSSIIELLKDKFGNRKSGTKLLSGIKVKLINPINVVGGYTNSSFKALNFQGRRAYYNASDKTIYINVAANYNNGNSSGVLLHELMHALTVDRILSNSESKTKFEEILKDYQNSNFDSRYREGEEHKLEEFIANIWTDPVTIENLKRIKSTRTNQSLWEEIKNFFNNIISKLFNDVSNDSLMAEASNELIKLLESPVIVQSKATFKENLSTSKKVTFYSEREVNQFIKDLKEYEDYSDNDIKVQYFEGTEDLDEYWEVTYGKIDATNNNPVNYTLHSGGAPGSDTTWGEIGAEFGIGKSNHYYTGEKSNYNAPNGNAKLSEEDYREGAVEVAKAAKYNWGYQYSTMKDPRLIRNWAPVKYADAIFAIGSLVKPGERVFPNQTNDTRVTTNATVTGGTGYAVGMAILHGKPVYVYDQNRKQWYKNIDGKWSESEVPTLTPNFAGIGTREINEDGKKAIREVYEKTFKSTPNVEPKTIEYTPTGKEKQTYTIVGNRIYNRKGEEVFKEESIDRNKIFGNLAVKEGRAVVVTYRDAKYVVNNKNAIMSVTSGKVMQWSEENGDRKRILALAQAEFNKRGNIQKSTIGPETNINIYAGTGENADLSNFAERPFTIPEDFSISVPSGIDISYGTIGINNSGDDIIYRSVEAAFQGIKSIYSETNYPYGTNFEALRKQGKALRHEDFAKMSGSEAKQNGRNITDLNVELWNKDSSAIMKALLKLSFEQNTQALQKLLATGNATLTHTQDKGKWGTEFPKLLMEVRDELRSTLTNNTSINTIANNTASYGVIIDPQLKQHVEQFHTKHPQGIIAYRVNFNAYNTAEEVNKGHIGNPFSEGAGQQNKGEDTVQKFYDWLITGNNFGNTKATEEFRQAIINKILNTPVNSPILYYTELNRPSHATVIGYLVNNKYLLNTNNTQSNTVSTQPTQNQPVAEAPTHNYTPSRQEHIESLIEKLDKEDRDFFNQSKELQIQLNNLLSNSLFTLSEIKDIANQMVYWISDTISAIQKDPSKASAFARLQGRDSYDIKKMSRKDLIKAIGISDLLKGVVNHFGNNTNNSMTNARKVAAIKKNWNAVWTFATSTLLENEGISVVNNTEIIEEDTENNPEPNDPNNETDIDAIRDMVGDSQEHWQIESRTMDILKTASQLMRKFLNECYVLDENGQQVMSSWGVPLRVKPREVVSSLIKWTQGATDIDLMIEALKSKVSTNPWLQEVITKLEDRSGNYTDLQSQFFSTIAKNTQIYYIVTKRGNKYVSIPVNNQPALRDAYNRVRALYNASQHPMFTTEGINMESLGKLNTIINHLKTLSNKQPIDKQESLKWIDYSLRYLGYDFTPTSLLEGSISEKDINKIISNLEEISKDLSNNKDNNQYNPFKWVPGGTNTLINNLRSILSIVTEPLEATAVSSFYDNGKMYQSNVTPSYLTKLIIKLNTSNNERFDEIMQEEYGKYTWFKQGNTWRTKWLRDLEGDRSILAHKVQLNFNKHSYMRNMTKSEYILSLITEYFSETKKNGKDVGWFRVPMMSNKPSSEFIRGCCFRGDYYKEDIVLELKKVFDQELSRIQTVRMRNRKKEDTDYITNFDERGKQFCFLDYMNVYLNNSSTELGRLIESKLKGNKVDEVRLNELATTEIRNNMESRVKNILNSWESAGIMKAAKDIQGVKSNTRESLENFIWNDTLASINILQLTITDPAFYKNAEDLQKRLAQLHAPGVRCNEKATDYKGREVSDGKLRTIYLSDFDEVVSNVIDNITEVFDRKIAKARNYQERKGLEVLKESLVGENGAYRKINVTDAQGYSSPASYRKKALMFGTWSIEAETIYQNLLNGNYKYDQLEQAFQPLKPFVYTQIEKSTNTDNTPLNNIKLPIQNKNSEYLLILADAILQGEKNLSKPNLLRAIYEVMEESATEIVEEEVEGKKFRRKTSKKNGIDTVQFNSAVKSGEMGTIDLRDCNTVAEAKALLKNTLYVEGDINKGYNSNHVHEIPAEDYCLQQNIPEHFKNHEQAHGSQPRYITIADLEITDSEGNDIKYKVGNKELTAQEFKREYEETISENIEKSLLDLADELRLDSENVLERNIALSKILQKEILSNSRYGVDLFIACSLNDKGEFRIPLGDPIQCKRVEQLINSIIKNRVNKQKIAGGPIVQVSNFGTSKQLSIRFKSKEKDKNGNNILLKTREEFNGTEEQYKQYIKENQAGIAYFECYAPIYSEELFNKFKNADGSIDIEAINAVNPDLLKMVGYRIPCEDKYSMTPLKIVGFLPREAGNGIMLPYDITTINGSDYDKHQCCSKSM